VSLFRAVLVLAGLAVAGAATGQPSVPPTMIDALGRVREAGWHGVELGDRRSVAVYRTRSGAMLALGYRPDGALVIAGARSGP
jgi:hypothetical protein